jgi:hypothetical protein
MKFNYAMTEENSNPSPEFMEPYGTEYKPITAQGNLTYLQFIDLIDSLWSKAYPDIKFLPFSAGNIYNKELGYVIYSLETRRTHNNNNKPRVHNVVDHPTEPDKKLIIYTQSFDNIVNFTCVHKNPRVAEELVEAFENFMLEVTPIFIKFGIEHFFYNRRMPDEHETRVGEDIASRTVNYLVVTQKIVYVDAKKLEEVITTIVIPDQEYNSLVFSSSATPSFTTVLPSVYNAPPFRPYASYYDTTTQTNVGILKATPVGNIMRFNGVNSYKDIDLIDNSKIKVYAKGTYNIQFSAQMDKTDSGTDELEIWIAVNGEPVEWSNSSVSLVGNNAKGIPSWNWFLDLEVNDYVEIYWFSGDDKMRILAIQPQSSPYRPGIPSVILTINSLS